MIKSTADHTGSRNSTLAKPFAIILNLHFINELLDISFKSDINYYLFLS